MSSFFELFGSVRKKLLSSSRLDTQSVEHQGILETQHRKDIGLGDEATFNSEAFNHVTRRSNTHQLFEPIRPDKNKSNDYDFKHGIFLALDKKDDAAAEQLRKDIAKALEPSAKFNQAQEDYNGSVAAFKDLVNQVPAKYKAAALIDTMCEQVHEARKAIVEQHQHEKQALEERFDKVKNPDFTANLNKVGYSTDSQIESVKKSMLEDLEAAQKQQLADFDKSTIESIKKLHQAAALETRRIVFLANLSNNNAEMKKILRDLAIQNQQGPNTTATINVDDDNCSLSGISLDKLETIHSVTGGTITQKKGDDGKPTFSLELSRRIFSPLYYADFRQNVKTDMLVLANAVRATGASGIKMSCNFPDDPELAQERGRQAFEACINAGFAPEDITISVNGETLTHQKPGELDKHGKEARSIYSVLFAKEHGAQYQQLKESSDKIIKKFAEFDKSTITDSQIRDQIAKPTKHADAKQAMDQLRTNAKMAPTNETPGKDAQAKDQDDKTTFTPVS